MTSDHRTCWRASFLPMVEMCDGSNSLSVNLRNMHVFPTPESPSMSSRNNTSYCLAMTTHYNIHNTADNMTSPSASNYTLMTPIQCVQTWAAFRDTSEISTLRGHTLSLYSRVVTIKLKDSNSKFFTVIMLSLCLCKPNWQNLRILILKKQQY